MRTTTSTTGTSTTATPSTSSATKALVAAGLGVVLLAGAGGTFALWNAEETTATGTITDGELALTVAAGTWTDDGAPIDPAAFRMAPGDTVTFSTTVVPTIVGDNLVATLTGSLPLGEQSHWDIVPNLPGGEESLDASDSGLPIPVTVDVTLPVGSDNSSQEQVLSLSDLTLNLQQVDTSL